MDVPEVEFRMGADAYLADLGPFLGDVWGLDEALCLYRRHDSNIYPGWQNYGRDPVPLAEQERKTRALLLHYENRVNALNDTLERMALPNHRVSLRDHWPYLYLKWKLGEGPSISALSVSALRFPGEPGLFPRAKRIVRLWLAALGLRGR